MRRPLTLLSVCVMVLAAHAAPAGVIIVDASGGGDYLTIQEGVDAAANLDTVLVYPGIYTDAHEQLIGYESAFVNVYFEKNITLMSSEGPGETIVDGQGLTRYGIAALPDPVVGSTLPPPVVEGFTVSFGGSGPAFESAGIVAFGAEARGNICTQYGSGLSNDFHNPPTGVPRGPSGRSGETVIQGNQAHSNQFGIWLREAESQVIEGTVTDNTVNGNYVGIQVAGIHDWTGETEIIGNTVEHNEIGIEIVAPALQVGHATLVGNAISENTDGVYVMNYGLSNHTGAIEVALEENQIFDNASTNVKVYCGSDYGACSVEMSIGGSLAKANDIFGAPCNVDATQNSGGEVYVDASYNYWGSILCDSFIPRFCLDGVPDSSFIYLPFTDETHTIVFLDCETLVTRQSSWGAIKALYR